MGDKTDYQMRIQISLNHMLILKINMMIHLNEHNKLKTLSINKFMVKIDLITDKIIMMNIKIYRLHQIIF